MKKLSKYEELLKRAERTKKRKALRKKKKIEEVVRALDPPSMTVRLLGNPGTVTGRFYAHYVPIQNVVKCKPDCPLCKRGVH